MAIPHQSAKAKSKQKLLNLSKICVRKLPSNKFLISNGVTKILFKGKLINLKKLYENIKKIIDAR